MRRRLLIGPAVASEATLSTLLLRLGHYFAHIEMESIAIPLSYPLTRERASELLATPAIPTGHDPAAAARLGQIAPIIEFVEPSADALETAALVSDAILMWREVAERVEPWTTILGRYRRHRTHFTVDWTSTRTEGAWFAEASHVLNASTRRFNAESEELFSELVGSLRGSERSFLIGTGPSARQALDIDCSDGVRIACNTVLLDDELMDHLQPQVVTFADPIFHFGPSTYGYEFRRALARQAQRFDFTVVTTERYRNLLTALVPEVASRTVGVRVGTPRWEQNFDLLHRLAVRPHPNILTMLMMPLAATFSRDINLIGFDGRSPDEHYFWRHGSTVQFEEKLQEIRLVHPGFFELDYGDYYDEHTGVLESIIEDLEFVGTKTTSLTPSFMLPLRRRATHPPQVREEAGDVPESTEGGVLISITPDWTGDFGHFRSWETAMRDAAAAHGVEHISLTSKGRRAESPSEFPVFTHGSHLRRPHSIDLFESELVGWLNGHTSSAEQGFCCIFYTADIYHLPSLLNAAVQRPEITFVVNLMRSHPRIVAALAGDPWARTEASLLASCVDAAHGTNLTICLDTETIAQDAATAIGVELPIWPMIRCTAADALARTTTRARSHPVSVVAPVHAQAAKGFHDVVALAERLAPDIAAGQISLSARHVPQPTGTPESITTGVARFRTAGGTLVSGNLGDEEFAALIGDADIVLIPYRLDPFRTRTSGIVLDALAAGKPVVAVRGTWVGDLIESYGVGVTYPERDVDQLVVTIRKAIDGLDALTTRVEEERDGLIERFHPARLLEFILAQANDGAAPDPIRVREIRTTTDTLVGTYASREYHHARADIARLVEIDDLNRLRDDVLDRAEALDRGVRWRQRKLDDPSRGRLGLSHELLELEYPRSVHAHLDELDLVAALIHPESMPDGVMVDVGAHHGSAFRRFYASGWTIHAFEPDLRHQRYLAERFAADPRVTLDARAVASRSGRTETFYISDESSGVSGLSAFLSSHVEAGTVETVALRDVSGIGRCDVLKVDTEGYEMEVLNGFPWDRLQPEVVVAEFDDAKTKPLGYSSGDLASFLAARGYQVWVSEWHPIVRYGIRHDWHRMRLYPSRPPADSWGNLIALASPVPEPAMAAVLAASLDTGGTKAAVGHGPSRGPKLKRMIARAARTVGVDPVAVRTRLRPRR